MPQIKAIIFDLGNVLVNFDHMIAARKIIGLSDKPIQEIYSLFFDSGITERFEVGEISSSDFFERVKDELNLKIDYKKFLSIWNEIFYLTEQNHAIYSLARKLKAKFTVVLLSNINKLHFEYLKNAFPVFDAFHEIFLSYELNLRKPDPLIYRHILEKFNLRPEETVYIDDRHDLIRSAEALGIRSLVFEGVEKLKKDLKGIGIEI